ncbi:LysR family transcriptional regulator [Dongshaea marina]|uniref:LysR family transcriptional regulator n=1 Tax=Dongshaea marina TaxID=2047966 RepID=UPI000D3EAFD7|nr:LysR family transcriptional regulator [Dongshaea marina]
MNLINLMTAFRAVAEEKSFKKAAEKLSVSTAIISRYISQLETSLEIRLINRSARAISLTEEGKIYYDKSLSILKDIDNLNTLFQEKKKLPSGKIRLTTSSLFLEKLITEEICSFLDKHPQIDIDITTDNKLVNLIESGVDLAIRSGKLADSNLISKKLCGYEVILCASPEYITKHGLPGKPEDLHQHKLILDSNVCDELKFKNDFNISLINGQCSLKINCGHVLRKAVLMGHGIGSVTKFSVINDINKGRLIQILEDYDILNRNAYLLYPKKNHLPLRTKLFIDHLTKSFEKRRNI